MIFDQDEEWEISPEALNYTSDFSIYQGRKVVGRPVATIVRGAVVADRGAIASPEGHGRYVAAQRPGGSLTGPVMRQVDGRFFYDSHQELVDPGHTALVLIDIQNDFCAKGGTFDRSGYDVSLYESMIPTTARLLAAARPGRGACASSSRTPPCAAT